VDPEAPLAGLAAFLPEIDKPDFDFGEWVPARRPAPSVVTMPYFAFSPEGLALLAAMPVQMDFNWGEWKDTDEAKGLLNDRDVLARATEEQLVKLSTTLMRADRFTDGALANAYASGLLAAMVRRAAALSERPQNNGAT
jgi:Family of unknown function (DUF6508)